MASAAAPLPPLKATPQPTAYKESSSSASDREPWGPDMRLGEGHFYLQSLGI